MSLASSLTVVVGEEINERALAYLAEHARVVRSTPEEVPNVIAKADGLVVRTYTQVNQDLLAAAPLLKVVGRAGVALDNIDVPACRARGVEVVHTPESNTLAVVDYTMGAIIMMNRRFRRLAGPLTAEEFHSMRKKRFGRFLSGATLGIVGAGRIGSRVGRAAVGLGMKVLYNDIRHVELDYPAEGVEKLALYARSDIVTIHVPMTELTRGMINAETLGLFKPGAQFINCARGPCVDYAALADAVRGGGVLAACIDCHDPEPPPPDYPMFGLDNVILTPHVAACVPEAAERMQDVVYDIIAVLEGRSPKYPAQEGSF